MTQANDSIINSTLQNNTKNFHIGVDFLKLWFIMVSMILGE